MKNVWLSILVVVFLVAFCTVANAKGALYIKEQSKMEPDKMAMKFLKDLLKNVPSVETPKNKQVVRDLFREFALGLKLNVYENEYSISVTPEREDLKKAAEVISGNISNFAHEQYGYSHGISAAPSDEFNELRRNSTIKYLIGVMNIYVR